METADGSNGCDTFYGPTQTAYTPPYTPDPNPGCADAGPACYPSTVGGVTNAAAPVMSFPVAVDAEALGVDFKPNGTQISGCPTTATQVQLSASEVSKIFSGDISNWDAVTDAGTSTFAWSGCNEPITRVVRADIAGTTQGVKIYLRSVDGSRVLCDGTNTWTTLATYNNNTVWPGSPADPCGGVTAPVTALGNGGGASCPATYTASKGVICALQVTGGGITYGDLSNWKSTPDVLYAEVVPTSGTTGVLPGSSATLGTGTPNCDTSFAGNEPGGGGGTDFVGLDDSGGTPDEPALTNWATDGADGSQGVTPPSDITNVPGSTKWPICTLTYDMVYSGLSTTNTTYAANAIGGLTADQRRTLYTFMVFVLSQPGQATLKANGYLPIPNSWASEETAGFEGAF
ncbi:MAG: substrate-binding domain-containing protein [Solirubrobacteraceae bacterium]